jgi:hypothetical protein
MMREIDRRLVMRVTTLVMGILGGVFGIILGLAAMAAGGMSNAFESGSGNGAVGLGISALLASAFGIVCASIYFSGRRPGLMTLGLLVATVWLVISISAFAIPGALFFLLATLFAFIGRHDGQRQALPPTTPMVS